MPATDAAAERPGVNDYVKPTIEYLQLYPMPGRVRVSPAWALEAFLPRIYRYTAQVTLTVGGLVVALVGTVLVARSLDVLGGGAARGGLAVESAGRGQADRLPLGADPRACPGRLPALRRAPARGRRDGLRRLRPRRCRAPRQSARPRRAGWSRPRSSRCCCSRSAA
ncbi:MAG: hypothetical protein R2734_03155 [Nocardioides sp.]